MKITVNNWWKTSKFPKFIFITVLNLGWQFDEYSKEIDLVLFNFNIRIEFNKGLNSKG